MTTSGVRNYSTCRNAVVTNTKRNQISAEHDMGYHSSISLFNSKPSPTPHPFHDHISIQKALRLFPSTQTHNNLVWILFQRNRLPPSSECLLKMQTVNSSETLLSTLHVILTQTTLCLSTTVKT
jgi:hypothetical protein